MLRTRRRHPGIIAAALAVCIAALVGADDGYTPPATIRAETELPVTQSGAKFQQAMNSVVPGVAWKETPLRGILRQLSEIYQVAIICDRRIDPTLSPEVTVSGETLRGVVETLSRRIAADERIVGNAVYIGPPERAELVRTLIELRKRELVSMKGTASQERWIKPQRPRSVRWGDLTSPRQIANRIADRFAFTISNIESLPHDLCGGGSLAEMTAAEMLTLLLIQYDLTFTWGHDLETITLVPLPSDSSEITVDQRFQPRGSLASAIEALRQKHRRLDARIEGREIVVRGRVEQIEAIEPEITGRRGSSASKVSPPDVVALERRQFTLSVSGVPVQTIIANLERSGTTFQYDAAALKDAGIDLKTPVSVDVVQASAREFFAAIFRPVGVDFEIDGTTVTLRPRE